MSKSATTAAHRDEDESVKILWVKAGGLVPPDIGGRIRSYCLLKELARSHSITLFTFYAAQPDDAHALLDGQFSRVVRWPLQLPPPRSVAEVASYARYALSGLPYSVAKYCRPPVVSGFRELLGTEQFDVIVCDFVFAGGVIPWTAELCPKVLFTHNVEALIWKRHYQLARNPFWKAVCWREYQTMARLERRYLQLADHVLTVSETDRHFFARFIHPAKITVIPTGVDVNYFQPSAETEKPNSLVFTGAMDWLANEDAIIYFAERILPLVRRQVSEASLWIVGRRPSRKVKALQARFSGVYVTGKVEDIRPYVQQASVFVVPLRVGSGTRLKIFEAMAMSKAVVATSVGAEGLPVTHTQNILLADKPDEFARSIVMLLRDRATRERLGQAARDLVARNYSWASAGHHLDSVLREVVTNASSSLRSRAPGDSFRHDP